MDFGTRSLCRNARRIDSLGRAPVRTRDNYYPSSTWFESSDCFSGLKESCARPFIATVRLRIWVTVFIQNTFDQNPGFVLRGLTKSQNNRIRPKSIMNPPTYSVRAGAVAAANPTLATSRIRPQTIQTIPESDIRGRRESSEDIILNPQRH